MATKSSKQTGEFTPTNNAHSTNMFIYHGHMDGCFERLCHRLSRSLAEVSSHHHRSDVKLFRSWRNLINVCVPCLSESHCDDSYSFARKLWEGYLGDAAPANEDLSYDADHAYCDTFCTLREMMFLAQSATSPAGSTAWQQEQLELCECLLAINWRVNFLYTRVQQRRNHHFLAENNTHGHHGQGTCKMSAGSRDKNCQREEEEGLQWIRSRIPFV